MLEHEFKVFIKKNKYIFAIYKKDKKRMIMPTFASTWEKISTHTNTTTNNTSIPDHHNNNALTTHIQTK